MRPKLQPFVFECLPDEDRGRCLSLRKQQQLAISYAFRSTLVSHPGVTLDVVRRVAEQ